jgi:hypothetical protein
MRRRIIVASSVAAAMILTATVLWLLRSGEEAQLEFRVCDAVSKRWVWGATMTLQDRLVRGYYQSDTGLLPYRFTGLKPGACKLNVSAEEYIPVSVPVTLKRGINTIAKPIELVGIRIPGLSKFIAFEDAQGEDIVTELRPVGEDGKAVTNHPCLDIWVGCRVFAETASEAPAKAGNRTGGVRGEELFDGPLHWEWDASPETTFRYHVTIPGTKLKASPSPFLVIDYLILVPDPAVISDDEFRALASKVSLRGDLGATGAAFSREHPGIECFSVTSENVGVGVR